MYNKIRRGFSMVELMVVVAIIAILVAMAAPAYQDYAIRAKVSELVAAASAFKSAIAAKANSDMTLASSGLGLTLTPFSGKITGGSERSRRLLSTPQTYSSHTQLGHARLPRCLIIKALTMIGIAPCCDWRKPCF
ncbi:MAG: pilin [Betaproteobacteria bacterium]|nr:pilin [Betaproteobacteria bacterium]